MLRLLTLVNLTAGKNNTPGLDKAIYYAIQSNATDNIIMLRSILLASLLLCPSVLTAATESVWRDSDQTLRGLISAGYEISGFTTILTGRVLTHRYLLRNKSSIFMCSESHSIQAGSVKIGSSCRELE